jgi:ribosomal-protein-alanine N-acetyltransferase
LSAFENSAKKTFMHGLLADLTRKLQISPVILFAD